MQEVLQAPGDVLIKRLIIISPERGVYVNVQDYLIELNIFESIFSTGITGSLVLSDSRNLVADIPLLGDEYLLVDIKTPTFNDSFSILKTFRIHSLTDKSYARDGNTQVLILNFTSIEIFKDIISPIFSYFKGTPHILVKDIYEQYINTTRNVGIENETNIPTETPLYILSNTSNKIKFLSNGWRPFRCINWICNHSLPSDTKACNFLFWETTKGFYFSDIEKLFIESNKNTVGNYIFSAPYTNTLKTSDTDKKLFTIKSLKVNQNFNQLENQLNGYLCSNLLNVDFYKKTYEEIIYDHVSEFDNYNHTIGKTCNPLFTRSQLRNPFSNRYVNYFNPHSFSDITESYSTTKETFGKRKSNLLELSNFRMTAIVPGRTDLQAGNLINIDIPATKVSFPEDSVAELKDILYSGKYLITSLNHKINLYSHYISLELTKDCLPTEKY
jgi:hypothetical protein